MTLAEGAGIVTRIARYYPNWLNRLDEEEMRQTFMAWAEEIAPLGELDEVWFEVRECLRAMPGPWPPGIFEIREFVLRRLAHRKSFVRCVPPPPRDPKDVENARYWLGEIRKRLEATK